MPSLGADMVAGTLVEWRVRPGDTVARGDIVAVVDTEKSAIEVEAFDSGVVEELLVEEGAHVPVGTPLARLASGAGVPTAATTATKPAEPVTAPASVPGAGAAPAAPPTVPTAGAPTAPPLAARAEGPHSPLVRRMARAHGIDLSTVAGSGPGGAVTRHDIDRAIGGRGRPRVSPYARRMAARLGVDIGQLRGSGVGGMIVAADVEVASRSAVEEAQVTGTLRSRQEERLAAQQRATAMLMARSKREIPHYHLQADIDLTNAMGWLEDHNRERAITARVLPAALLLKAVATAARDVPAVNGHWTDGTFHPSAQVRLGVAISLRGGGLIAPAIADADQRSVDELMATLRQLISDARAGTLRSSQMVDPTITVTNLGDQGAQAVFGVIYPPQVALVGFGRISERPWASDGAVEVRVGVTATLAGDHRVSDGHRGSRCLATIDRLLQEPERL